MLKRRLLLVGAATAAARGAELRRRDNQAFDDYLRPVDEAWIQLARIPSRPLAVDGDPAFLAEVRRGRAAVRPVGPRTPVETGDCLIHDWLAAALVPTGKAQELTRILQSFDRHKDIYSPEVVDSRLIRREGDRYFSFLRLRKKKVITVLLNTEYETHFFAPAPGRGLSIVRSTKIAEISHAGERDEKEMPPGTGYGFLWRLHSFWRWEERPEGLFMELRSITLSRDIPTGLGWIIAPMVRSLPRESLEFTMERTRQAVLAGP